MGIASPTKPPDAAADPLNENLPWLLAQASHVLNTEMTAAFEELGVPPRGHCVLSVARTGDFTQKQLAETIGLDKTTMVTTIDALERAGLAERRVSATDRRAYAIAVTKAGERLVEQGETRVRRLQEEVLGSLPARQRKAFMAALTQLVGDRLATPAACEHKPRRR